MITNMPKSDLIYNALLAGMSLKDSFIYAGLTETEMSDILSDDEKMAYYNQLIKQNEYSLLEKLKTVADKQMNMGKESAITWMLERVNPDRWGGKAKTDELPDVHIHLAADDAQVKGCMEIHAPQAGTDTSGIKSYMEVKEENDDR